MLMVAGIALMATPAAGHHPRNAAPALTLTSSAFDAGSSIPSEYTCDGEGISPPLAWTGVPRNASTLALIVDDPDAPDPKAPTTTWVHWVLYDIPASATDLPKAVQPDALPTGTRAGTNDFKKTQYGGPCPPVGTHRYFFKLYALDTNLADLHAPTKAQLEAAMQGHVIAQGELMGTYRRSTP
jgi:Raf kinase inhibitor-like YbhB/YbcL family protein